MEMRKVKKSLVKTFFGIFTSLLLLSSNSFAGNPVVTSTPVTGVTQDMAYSYTLAGQTTTSNPLTWSVTGGTSLPSWLHLGDPGYVTTFAGSTTSGQADGNGTAATFKTPRGVAIDSKGNFYIADSTNNLIRKITPAGVVTTFAGSTTSGHADGTGTAASFHGPYGVAVDSNDNIYVADSMNNEIRKITPAGVVTTFAGSTTSGSADGTGTAASFFNPQAVAVDNNDNIYVADSYNYKIRKITSTGVVSTVAGDGTSGYSDATGTAAKFNKPTGVAVDASGNIYVADYANNRIRKITTSGVVSTLAGGIVATLQDGTGTSAFFNYPAGVAVDGSGNIYVADMLNNSIRKVTQAGVVTTLAGSTTQGHADGNRTSASFYYPSALAIDSNGYIYVADAFNNEIRKVTPSSMLTGTPTNADVGVSDVNLTLSDTVGTATQNFQITVAAPPTVTSTPVTVATQGSVYNYTFEGNSTTNALTWGVTSGTTLPSWLSISSSAVVTTFAGSTTSGSADGNGTAATFHKPYGVAVDSHDNIYVADTLNNEIRKITPAGVVTTFAGSTSSAVFSNPSSTAVDSHDNIYVTDTLNNKIKKITPTGVVTTFAGSLQGSVDGTGTAAKFNNPAGIAIDSSDNIYVADMYNNEIRKITPAGVVTTFAGSTTSGNTDGTGTAAKFHSPSGVTVDSHDNIYVADVSNNEIRKITPAGVVTTFAGSTTPGNTDGTGTAAKFHNPYEVAVDSHDNIYVADGTNNEIRKITPAGVVTTFAGSTTSGSTDGNGPAASFSFPTGIVVDSNDNIYVADAMNNEIRKIVQVEKLTGTPTSSDIGTHTISLTVSDSNGGKATQNFQITVAAPPTVTSTPITAATKDKLYVYLLKGTGASGLTWSATSGHPLPSWLQLSTTSAGTKLNGTPKTTGVYDVNLTLSDADARETTQNFQITVAAQPTVTSTPVTVATQGSAYSYRVAGSTTTAEDLSWSATSGTTLPSWLSLEPLTTPTVFAGTGANPTTNGGISDSADGTLATGSKIKTGNIYIDSASRVFFTDKEEYGIRYVDENGTIQTFYAGDGTYTNLNPVAVVYDANKSAVYVANYGNGTIVKIKNGIKSDIAAGMHFTTSLLLDSKNNLLYAGTRSAVYKIDLSNSSKTRIVGDGAFQGSYADTGTASTSKVHEISDMILDAQGHLIISDRFNHIIRKIDLANNTITTIAGTEGNSTYSGDGGLATAATFHDISALAIDSSGNIYAAERLEKKIRKIDTNGTIELYKSITTVGPIYSMAIDHKNGDLYIAGTNQILKIPSGFVLSGTPTNADVGTVDVNLTISDTDARETTQNFQITVRTPAANTAMEKIAAYATDSTQTTPTVQDYTDAGITGVNATNLTQVNTEVAKKDATGVDTEVKIQTLVASVTGVSGGNHAPVIDTVFNDRTIAENALSFQVDVNISDKDGDDLNLTVESDNTALLQVTQNYTNLLNQAAYNGVTLDFNLTSQTDANGVAQITLSLNDGTATTTKTFKVTVTPIVALSQMSDVVVYKNSGDANITLHTSNAQNNVYTYSAQAVDTTLVSHISFDGDIMIITPAKGVSGTTDINITVKDSNNVSSSKVLKFIILPLEKNSNFSQQAQTTTTTSDGNSTSIDLTGLSGKITTDTNGTVEHIMTIGDINTTSRSELAGSVVAFTSTGVHTTYSDTNLSIEVNATMTGKAIHELTVGGVTTKAVSEFLGASTIIGKDANGSVEITTSVKPNANTSISVVAKADGTAQYKVKVNGVKTVATSELKGASTIIDSNANVTTTQNDSAKDETVNGDTWKFEAVIKTDAQGRTVTVFERKNSATGALKDVQDTFKPSTPYDPGNKVTIGDIGGVLYFQIKTSVTYDLVVK